MSELMKKLPTDALKIIVEKNKRKHRMFLVPKSKAKGVISLIEEFEVNNEINTNTIDANTAGVFSDLNQKYSKPGAILRGARLKEGLSQKKLAEQMRIPQNHISEMEHGKRPIGKKMSQRFSKILKINYKVFL